MSLRYVCRSLAVAFRSGANVKDVRWISTRQCHTINGQSNVQLSYVQRTKILQNLREKKGITEDVLQKGKCLVYHKGDPLLTDDFSIAWLNFSDLQVEPKHFLDSAMLLGMTENNQFQFAVQIANFGNDVKKTAIEKSQANFTDFRLSLMVIAFLIIF